MKPRDINPENYIEVYEYFKEIQPNEGVIKLGYGAFNAVFRPKIFYAAGAREKLNTIQESNSPRIYTFNHLSNYDALISGAILTHIAPDDVGKIRTYGADFNFRAWYRKLAELQGGIPVFRRQDYQDIDLHDVHDALFDTGRDILASGTPMTVLPEGKINTNHDTTRLLKVHSGVGELACRTANLTDAPIHIVTTGMSYGETRTKVRNPFHVSSYTNEPITVEPGDMPGEVTDRVRDSLQHATTSAVQLYLGTRGINYTHIK